MLTTGHTARARAAILLLALLAPPASSQTRFAPLSPAPPAATVLWGAARFSFLSDTLVRLELASPSTGAFDDRPSLAIVNRSALPPPALSVSTAGAALTVRTAALTLRYAPPGGNSSSGGGGGGNHSICALAQGADVTGAFSRVPEFPLGAIVADVTACCSLCDNSAQCNAFVFAPHPSGGADPAGTNCWVLMGVSALVPSSSRIAALRQSGFDSSLSVTFQVQGQASATVWNASMTSATDAGQLRGVWHALDCYDTPEVCTASYNRSLAPGLLSRSGWALLDDTDAARLVPTAAGVPSPIPFWYANASAASKPGADLYLFAAGLDYGKTLREYAAVGGAVPLAPRSVYGVWWSHWQTFTQAEFTSDILGGYANYSLPLDHVMLDVDWHTEDPGNASVPCYSYGGWSVNTALWPQWGSFVASLHDGSNPTGRPLKLMLNLHPQGGFDACQRYWPAFSAATGYTNASRIMPCTFGDQRIAAATFSAYMDGPDLAAVDGWWTDYDYTPSDCADAPSSGLSHSSYPIAWSNEVFGGHAAARGGGRRPLLLSRSGGLGAHRNPVSFSGDANQHRSILQWEIAATPTAANALHSHWSHDVGGFMCQDLNQSDCSGDPSLPSNGLLYLRWLQAAVTFPILRTHASTWNVPKMERRVWKFPQYAAAMADALRLRSALLPYTYSAAAEAALASAVAPMHPLYYEWPLEPEAYSSTGQYLFGSALLAAPIWDTSVPAEQGGVAGGWQSAWLPPLPGGAQWCSWNGTECSAGGAGVQLMRFYAWGDTPLLARSGALVPMQGLASVGRAAPDPLVLTQWPFAPGQQQGAAFALYEDDGDAALPAPSWRVPLASPAWGSVTVGAAQGDFPGAPAARALEWRLRGVGSLAAVASVAVNGQALRAGAAGCAGGCFYCVSAAQHSLLAPEGTLVVTSPGRLSTRANNTLTVVFI